MRILYLSEARGVGGAEIYLERLALGLRDDVTTLAAPRTLAAWAQRVSERGGRVVLHDGWSSFPALVRLAREHDLVHLNLPSTYDGNAGFLGWALTALAGRPLVVTEHLTRIPRSRRREWVKRRTAGAPAAVLCVSEASADPLRARGIPRIVVVPNGVPDPGPPAPMPDGPLTVAVLEAFAAGRGVLVSDLPGLDEVVTGDREGRRLPVDDVAAWADALEGAREAAPRWGEAARATFRERFTLERFLADTRGVYARVTGGD